MLGYIELIFGSMYCGKSEELIRRLKRARFANQNYQLFKPSLDDRYGIDIVSTHESNRSKKEIQKIIDIHMSESKSKDEIIDEITKQLDGAMKANVVKNSKDILNEINPDTSVIGIDEVQFFDEGLIDVVLQLAKSGKRVICAGLDMYADGKPFGNVIPYLACVAKYVDKLHAVCMDCGNEAIYSHKIDNNMDNKKGTIDVGSDGKYIAICEKCRHKRWLKLKN